MITISYNGANFNGFQRQSPPFRTVEGELYRVIGKIYDTKIVGCSRTDSGVHALNFVLNFIVPKIKLKLDKLLYVLNSQLPPDICVLSIKEVPEEFNARHDAVSKTYIYKIYSSSIRNPFFNKFYYYTKYPPNITLMEEAGKMLTGTFDFKAFQKNDPHNIRESTVRTIYSIRIRQSNTIKSNCVQEDALYRQLYTTNDNQIQPIYTEIEVSGNGFLYNMVRIISGTLLHYGHSLDKDISLKYTKNKIVDIEKALKTGDRKYAGETLPANGLYLLQVNY